MSSATLRIVEFFNQCHAKNGKFCTTASKGSKGSGASTVAEALAGSTKALKSASKVARDAVNGYAEAEYRPVNVLLRHGEKRAADEFDTPDVESARNTVKGMDEAFDTASVTLANPVTLYRGQVIEPDEVKDGFDPDKWGPGTVISDKAYVSSSVNRDIAEAFAMGRTTTKDVVFRINAPGGTRLVAGRPSEEELIIDRGAEMKVTKVSKSDSGTYLVDVDLSS